MKLYGQRYTRRKEFHRIAKKLLISRLLLECCVWQESNWFSHPFEKDPATIQQYTAVIVCLILLHCTSSSRLWNCDACQTNTVPFYWHGLTLITAWVSNYIYCKVWDEITYHSTLCQSCAYLSMLGLKLNRVSKGGPSNFSHKTNKASIFARLLF